MSTNIEPYQEPPLIPSAKTQAKSRRSTSSFIPGIKLLQPGSKECKQNPSSYQGGQYLVDDINLSDKFRAVVVSRRDHALRFVKNQKDAESFDPNSDLFTDIAETTSNFDEGTNTIVGSEWLLWLCDHGQFAAFHAGKSSTEPLTADLIRILATNNRLVTVFSTLKSWGAKYSALSARASEIPPDQAGESTLPTEDQLTDAKDIFMAPVKAEATMEEVDEECTD